MAEPDFEQIARRLNTGALDLPVKAFDDEFERSIAEALRQVWMARGAADLATISAQSPCMTFSESELPKDGCKHCGWTEMAHDDAYRANLDEAIRKLDR